MKNILIRSLSGIIYIAIVLFCVLTNDITMLALTLVLAIPAIKEYSLMMQHKWVATGEVKAPEGKILTLRVIQLEICALTLVAALWQLFQNLSSIFFGIFLLTLVWRMLLSIYSKENDALRNLAYDLGAILYIALPLGLLNYIYAVSPHLVLALFLFIWINDTGAFLFGSAIGRHKLFPSVSPKKSWEGFIGGIAVVLIAAIFIYLLFPEYNSDLSMPVFIIYAAIVSIFATWGDLLESFIKRTTGVKDSGTLMPGHGGALDRIDSLLMVSLATTAFLMII